MLTHMQSGTLTDMLGVVCCIIAVNASAQDVWLSLANATLPIHLMH